MSNINTGLSYKVCGSGGQNYFTSLMALILYALLTIKRLKTKTIKITQTDTHPNAKVKADSPPLA